MWVCAPAWPQLPPREQAQIQHKQRDMDRSYGISGVPLLGLGKCGTEVAGSAQHIHITLASDVCVSWPSDWGQACPWVFVIISTCTYRAAWPLAAALPGAQLPCWKAPQRPPS